MKKIKEIISKPSEALQAMVDGLVEQEKREDFKISMRTYGDSYGFAEPVCYGCAATCAVQKLFHHDFKSGEIESYRRRALVLHVDPEDLAVFEKSIDHARSGDLRPLFCYLGVNREKKIIGLADGAWFLSTYSWKKQLPLVQEHIEALRMKGF